MSKKNDKGGFKFKVLLNAQTTSAREVRTSASLKLIAKTILKYNKTWGKPGVSGCLCTTLHTQQPKASLLACHITYPITHVMDPFPPTFILPCIYYVSRGLLSRNEQVIIYFIFPWCASKAVTFF